jgi:hypothetical protein
MPKIKSSQAPPLLNPGSPNCERNPPKISNASWQRESRGLKCDLGASSLTFSQSMRRSVLKVPHDCQDHEDKHRSRFGQNHSLPTQNSKSAHDRTFRDSEEHCGRAMQAEYASLRTLILTRRASWAAEQGTISGVPPAEFSVT